MTEKAALQELIDFHSSAASSSGSFAQRAFHTKAAEQLTELASPDPIEGVAVSDGLITVRLDLLDRNGGCREGYLTLRLPIAPLTGEGLMVGDERFRVHARIHVVDAAGIYLAGLAVEKLG